MADVYGAGKGISRESVNAYGWTPHEVPFVKRAQGQFDTWLDSRLRDNDISTAFASLSFC